MQALLQRLHDLAQKPDIKASLHLPHPACNTQKQCVIERNQGEGEPEGQTHEHVWY